MFKCLIHAEGFNVKITKCYHKSIMAIVKRLDILVSDTLLIYM